jgi:hypothetical protein
VESIEKTKMVGSTKRTEVDRLSRRWLIASAIGALVGALAAMALWTPLPGGARSLAPIVLPMLPPVAVALGQAVTLYRLAPKLAMAIAWMIATLVLFIVAQAIAMFGFISASHLSPMETAFYYAIGATPGGRRSRCRAAENSEGLATTPDLLDHRNHYRERRRRLFADRYWKRHRRGRRRRRARLLQRSRSIDRDLGRAGRVIISMAQAFRFRKIVIDAEP